jgi:4-amino-4-deoxy-L-arabinose transferase-like glycosyltransferase
MRGWSAGVLCAILVASALVYAYQLDRVPAYLTLDEAHFSVHAASLARTGRNLNGALLPPLISLDDPEGEPMNLPWGSTYYLPFGVYLIAGALQVLPLDEATVRLPSALLGGVVNVALIYAVALMLFRNRLAAGAAAAVLALTPANVIISRQALDSVCQPPFILGALWCLAAYLRKPDSRLALAAGVILGCGVYAYVTSVMFMPFYLAMFWLIGWRAKALDRRAVLYSIAGFAAALIRARSACSCSRSLYSRRSGFTTCAVFPSSGYSSSSASSLRRYPRSSKAHRTRFNAHRAC